MIDSRAKDDQGNPIYENWGLAYRRIKYDHWRQNVFTGISRTPSQHWDKKYLSVVDVTDPFDEEADCRSCDTVRPGGRTVSDFVCTYRNGNIPRWAEDITIFTEEDAQGIREIVLSELQEEGLIPDASGKYSVAGASDDWRAILEGTRPCGVYPVSPPYINVDGFYYYLVEMVKEGYECNMEGLKPMPAAILVSACEGNEHVLEMAAVTREGTTALHFAPPELFISAVADRVREMSARANNPSRILLAPDPDAMPTPSEIRLVWEPVMGGLSPYAPFYRFEIPGPKGSDTGPNYFFVRADFWGSRTLFIPTDPQQPLPNVKTDIFMKYRLPVPSGPRRREDT